MAQKRDAAVVQQTIDGHLPNSPLEAQHPPQDQGAQLTPSPKELLWCYQLRQEHVALARRTYELETQLGHIQKNQQNGDQAYITLSELNYGLSTNFKTIESSVNDHAARIESIEKFVAERPDTATTMRQLLCTVRSEMADLVSALSKPCRDAEVAFNHRLDAAEGVLQLLVQTTESMRRMASGLMDELRRVQGIALGVQERLNTQLAPTWHNEEAQLIEKKTTNASIPIMDTCKAYPNNLTAENGPVIARNTTIMDSQPAKTSQGLVPSWGANVANSWNANKQQEQYDPSMSQWSPEVEEHHRYGGSLEIDQMPPPLGSEQFQSYVSTLASVQRACTTVTATSSACTGPEPTVPPQISMRQGNRTLSEYLGECRILLHERFPLRRDEAKAVSLFLEGLNEDDEATTAKLRIEETLEQTGWLWEVCCDVVEELEHEEKSATSASEEQEESTRKVAPNARKRKKGNFSGENYKPSTGPEADCVQTPGTGLVPLAIMGEQRDTLEQVGERIRTTPNSTRVSQEGKSYGTSFQSTSRTNRKPSLLLNVKDQAGAEPGNHTDSVGGQQAFPKLKKRRRREIPIIWGEESLELERR